jgi:PRTRC genetic system ThiF family protein
LERARAGAGYWLDFGNRAADGQAILGQVSKDARKQVHPEKLPHVAELFPEIIDEAGDEADDAPSCSLVEALERQDLFVNRTVVDHGMNLLWQLFRYGKISHHGVFVNVASHRVTPLPVDPQAWARYGYHAGQRIITPRKTGKKHKAVNDDHHRHAA